MSRNNLASLLTIEGLGQIDDGSLGLAFRKQLMMMARDVLDRPRLKKKRKLTLHITAEALLDGENQLRGVAIECELVPVKIPNYVTFPASAKVSANGFEVDQETPAVAQVEDPDE